MSELSGRSNLLAATGSKFGLKERPEDMKKILDRVLTWPPERQADLAHVAELMEEQDRGALQLTDEQLAEVRRRRAEKNPKSITLAEFNERLRRRYGV